MDTDNIKTINPAKIALIVIVGLLFFVWPLPHSISLRQSLLALTFLLSAYLAFKARPRFRDCAPLAIQLAILIALTIWMYVVAIFISTDTASVLHDIRGQWMMSLLVMFIGVLAALASGDRAQVSKGLLLAVFTGLMLHVLYHDVDSVFRLSTDGALLRNEGALAGGRDKMSYISIFAVTFCIAEGYLRVSGRRNFLPISAPLLALIFLSVLFSLYLGGSRNAIALTLVLFMAAGVFFVCENGIDQKKAAILTAVSLAIIILGYASATKTPQWRTLAKTIPLALDIETNKCWLDCEKYPMNVDMTDAYSNYLHIAWFKAGAVILGENPLGRGYEKNAYGHAVRAKYNEGAGEGHSHSAVIDFGIGNGIPGLVMLYAFFIALIYTALKVFKSSSSFSALLLAFIIFGVAVRSVVDSTLRDHMLQQIMFLIGLLAVLMVTDGRYNRPQGGRRGAIIDE